MSDEETRVVDPVTGGEKGQKLARFDLIPAVPMLLVARSYTGAAPPADPFEELQVAAWRFWSRDGDDTENLVTVARCALDLVPSGYGAGDGFSALPHTALWLLAEHYGRGARKYADRNWELGYRWSLSFGALMRHAWADARGEQIDPETGSPHLIAVAWHAFALLEYSRTHPELDDRPTTKREA